jgi:hypothetical protein
MHSFLEANLQRSSTSSSSISSSGSKKKNRKQKRGVPIHMVGKPNYPEPALLAQYEMVPAGLSHRVRRATAATAATATASATAAQSLLLQLSTAEAAWEGVVQHMPPPVCSAASGASLSIGMCVSSEQCLGAIEHAERAPQNHFGAQLASGPLAGTVTVQRARAAVVLRLLPSHLGACMLLLLLLVPLLLPALMKIVLPLLLIPCIGELPPLDKYSAEWWESTLWTIWFDAVAEGGASLLEKAMAVPTAAAAAAQASSSSAVVSIEQQQQAELVLRAISQVRSSLALKWLVLECACNRRQ